MHSIQSKDRFLLCTDGVSNALPVSTMLHLLLEQDSTRGAAKRLVESAVEHGGQDNATAIVVDISIDSDNPDSESGLSSVASEGTPDA